MDRREAMLRELNLYPLWVRRVVPEPEAVQETPIAVTDTVATPAVTAATVTQQEAGAAEPSLFELAAAGPPVQTSAEDSLRVLQLKIAAGPLADLGWSELRQQAEGCELCTLRAGCTQTVFGAGDENAGWMFIGEAPGAEEDAAGEPFVGHAGRLLGNMLLSLGLQRDKVYIANVIKCRPPEDRHPHVGEITACLPYLKRQIGLVRPKIIVALGKTAASALLETDATIASLRGSVHDYQGIPLVVTFHPAYLLRSPMEKAKAWQDLCLAVSTMQGTPSGEPTARTD